ncbi:hypothetical protein Pve01_16720 [Planomonospora venezuelensis]|nr:hypothetical protein Pve01_16720 [Planomonospora venezuelensis]
MADTPPEPHPPAPHPQPGSRTADSPPLADAAPEAPGESTPELGELTFSDRHARADKLVGIGFLTIARRLPALVVHAVSCTRYCPTPGRPCARRACATGIRASAPAGRTPLPNYVDHPVSSSSRSF